MYLNTARFIIRFILLVKSAFPFTNKSKVTTGVKLKKQQHKKKQNKKKNKTEIQLILRYSTYIRKQKVFGVFEDSSKLQIGFDTIITRERSAFRLVQLCLIRVKRIEETLSPYDG